MTLYHQVPDCDFYVGDMRDVATQLPEKSVHVVVCSPPYWNLRDYGIAPSIWLPRLLCRHEWQESNEYHNRGDATAGAKQKTNTGAVNGRDQRNSATCLNCGAWRGVLGLEKLHDCGGWVSGYTCSECYICHMWEVARSVWKVLRDDGTFWVNISDSYASSWPSNRRSLIGNDSPRMEQRSPRLGPGLKEKDRVGIPERLALALQSDGWTWRDSIHLCKLAPMPESVTDRTTQAHENLFLFTKKARYYFDAEAVKEDASDNTHSKGPEYHDLPNTQVSGSGIRMNKSFESAIWQKVARRNPRSWMEVHPESTGLAHYATFVGGRLIPRFAIRAGSSEYGVCGACGNPWQRVTQKGPPAPNRPDREPARFLAPHQAGNIGAGEAGFRATNLSGTEMAAWRKDHPDILIGWRPTCSCEADVMPATIWDPFSGSGTTSIVARELGRRSIYTDASQPYADIAIKRMQETTLALPMTSAPPESAKQLTFG